MWTRQPVLFTLAGAALLSVSACGRRSQETSPRPAADSVQMGYGAQPKDKVTGAVTTLSN